MLAILCLIILVHILNFELSGRTKAALMIHILSLVMIMPIQKEKKKQKHQSLKALHSSPKEPTAEASSLSCCIIWKINFCTGPIQ